MSAKDKKRMHAWIREGIQLLYFLFLPSAYTAAFAGVKYIFTQIGKGESIGLTSFVAVLIVLCSYTMVFGRFFCGYACAFGSMGDALRAIYKAICKKMGKKPVTFGMAQTRFMSYVKYVVLAVVLILCYMGIFGDIQKNSPWVVFSMIHAGNFKLGDYTAAVVLLVLICVGMCVQERFFCRFLCPMGAVFAMLPVLPFFSLRRDRESCIKGCSGCERICPSDISLPKEGSLEVRGECFQCHKCVDACPKTNVHCGVHKELKGYEIWFTLCRAGILLGLLLWLGI